MSIVLGVDGGGTQTEAVVADDRGTLLGVGTSGPSNWEDVGLGGAGAAFRVAVGEALSAAAREAEELSCSVFGLAGVDWTSDVERLGFAIDPLRLGGDRQIVNDSMVALRAGTDNASAVVVVAGTGSVVAGRSASATFRTLGLGRLFGDFNSGSEVSEEAVRAVAQAYVGRGPATGLSELLCRRFERRTVAELLEHLSRRETYGRVEDDIEDVSPLVIAAATDGDGVAREILDRAGRELGSTVVLVAARLGILRHPFDVVLTGGFLAAAGELVSGPLEQVVRLETSEATFRILETPPVVGAALTALEGIGADAGAAVRARLRDEVRRALAAVS